MREVDALRGLAEGKVYKQIADEMSLSVSTIRTHLHNVYRKIGAVDRAQAVLIATATAAGSSRDGAGLLDQRLAQGDRDRVGAVAGAHRARTPSCGSGPSRR